MKACHNVHSADESGRACSGPSTGLLIVQVLPGLNRSMAGCDRPVANAQKSLLSLYQPSRAPVFEQFFVDTLCFLVRRSPVLALLSTSHGWDTCLLTFHVLTSSSIRYVPASLAYYADTVHDPAMQKEADRWYTFALNMQRTWLERFVAQNNASQSHAIPTEEEICASMMLLYFELIRPTMTASWMKHLNGACQLVEMRGPGKLSTRGFTFISSSIESADGKPRYFLPSDFAVFF